MKGVEKSIKKINPRHQHFGIGSNKYNITLIVPCISFFLVPVFKVSRDFLIKKRLSLSAQLYTIIKLYTQARKGRTDTQRGVLPGLSRERNLRSKI